MFPAFYHPDEALRACREVATSLANCPRFFGQDIYQLAVSLLGTSDENISLLSDLMEAMATCLQGYCPRDSNYSTNFNIIIHEKSIQVSSRRSQRSNVHRCLTDAMAVS